MSKKTLVFTATYNESENIKLFLDKILSLKIDLDILIIDDNSPDGTSEIISSYKNKYKSITLVTRESKQGLDTAHKFGFKYAKKNNYDYFITLDADLSHDPLVIPDFIKNLKHHPFIIGSRYIEGGKNDMKFSRFLQSYLGNKLIRLISGIKSSEFTTSFRGFNLKELLHFDMSDVDAKGYTFFMGTIFNLIQNGYIIKQIPIIFKDRSHGYSKIPKNEIYRTLKKLLEYKQKKNNV
jgi:dolichol-phosphate mannosyltransferase